MCLWVMFLNNFVYIILHFFIEVLGIVIYCIKYILINKLFSYKNVFEDYFR